MSLPRWIARFNKRVTNRFAEPIARRFANFAVVHHVGRVSGRPYTTPVNWFGTPDNAFVALTYGPDADWAQNVLRGPAYLLTGGQGFEIVGVDQVHRAESWPYLPRLVRFVLRALRVHHFLRLRLRPR